MCGYRIIDSVVLLSISKKCMQFFENWLILQCKQEDITFLSDTLNYSKIFLYCLKYSYFFDSYSVSKQTSVSLPSRKTISTPRRCCVGNRTSFKTLKEIFNNELNLSVSFAPIINSVIKMVFIYFIGVIRDDSCQLNTNMQVYKCGIGLNQRIMLIESMDADALERRLSPIAFVTETLKVSNISSLYLKNVPKFSSNIIVCCKLYADHSQLVRKISSKSVNRRSNDYLLYVFGL